MRSLRSCGTSVPAERHFISAPHCAKLLADLGADVLKVEPPAGDRARQYGPAREISADNHHVLRGILGLASDEIEDAVQRGGIA